VGSDFLTTLGLFFAKLAIVTFGGAYAVLTYMTQTVVQDLGWLTHGQMIDALGLAETTPGPLILVTEFVAWLAGIRAGRPGHGRHRRAAEPVGHLRAVLPVHLRLRALD
jgi:chromate transporter